MFASFSHFSRFFPLFFNDFFYDQKEHSAPLSPVLAGYMGGGTQKNFRRYVPLRFSKSRASGTDFWLQTGVLRTNFG